MIAEFYRPEPEPAPDPTTAAPPGPPGPPKPKPAPVILGRARWDGAHAEISAEESDVETALLRVFRPTSVNAPDPAAGSRGSSGPSVIQPGSLEWFRWAAIARAPEEGLAVRLVASTVPGGWDPAATYRRFADQVRRLQAG